MRLIAIACLTTLVAATSGRAELLPPVQQPAPILSNFDTNTWLVPAWGTGQIPAIEPPVGAFRFICNVSHLLPDDPIVYPGRPGASHLHVFFGNTMANAYSTYETLRK